MTELTDHKRELETRGITRVNGLLSEAEVRVVRDMIYEIASEHDLYTSTGWQRSQSRFGVHKPFRAAINALTHSDRFPNLVSDSLIKVAENLIGEPVTPLHPGQQLLFTLPSAISWSVPNDVWHVDFPRLGKLGPPGLQMFTFIEDVQPKGGGTLVIAGSHRLLNTSNVIRSKKLKQLLRKEPYFRSLFDAKRAPITSLENTAGFVGDLDMEIVELTGRVGDVYFMDLRVLHTLAPNASETARLMLTCRLPRVAIASKWLDPEADVQVSP